MAGDFRFLPFPRVEIGEESVPGDVGLDLGKVDHVGDGQRFAKERSATDYARFAGRAGRLPGRVEGAHHRAARSRIVAVAAYDDVLATGERPPDRFVRAPSHD